jgi:AraC-like DNA-binding protein
VAARVGYDSEAAFNRAFKRATGSPPATWRKSTLSASMLVVAILGEASSDLIAAFLRLVDALPAGTQALVS